MYKSPPALVAYPISDSSRDGGDLIQNSTIIARENPFRSHLRVSSWIGRLLEWNWTGSSRDSVKCIVGVKGLCYSV